MASRATANLLGTAREYRDAGLCVLPAIAAEKRPALPRWKEYQRRPPTRDEINKWFGNGDAAICLVTGAVSGNLEMIDFDFAGELFAPWTEIVRRRAPGLVERLVVERSQSGGRHVVYRSDCTISGNLKLAQRAIETPDDQPVLFHGKTYQPRKHGDRHLVIVSLIETRGEGGLFLCAPAPGYELVQGEFTSLPILTEDERLTLLDAAWQLNEWNESTDQPAASTDVGDRPGDDFNRRGDVREILRKHGWKLVRDGDNEYWRRPGKDRGWSATLKDGVFYVFTSNAPPFDMEQAYSPFAVYALLERDGDFARAASALMCEGYGQTDAPTDVDLSQFGQGTPRVEPIPVRDLLRRCPTLRAPVIMGLLRQGETMNVIAAPKTGKSWLVLGLAMAVATGRPWLDAFHTVAGNVLIIDNELHQETLAHRIPQVAAALNIGMDEIAETICVQSLRGQLRDLFTLRPYFESLEPGRFALVVLDAFYRFMPRDMDENDNGTMASLYNHIDLYADRLGCSFVLIHHTTKGSQAAKSVTDVGAGAGSQSRATDTHLVMRPHEEVGAVVLDAAVRSWAPIEPLTLRWEFPIWKPDSDLDPAALKRERPAKRKPPDATPSPKAPAWTVERFVEAFITEQPAGKPEIREAAKQEPGLSWRRVADFLEIAETRGLVHRWRVGRAHKAMYATVPPPVEGGRS